MLLDPDRPEVHKRKEIPSRTKLMLTTRHALKKQVWDNARRRGWLT